MSKTKKPIKITTLEYLHLAVFVTGLVVITTLHIYTKNFWDFLRLPLFLKDIDGFLGFAWPASLHVYQSILVLSLFLALIDSLGLFFYKYKIWKILSDLTSFLGFLIIWPVALFFILTLTSSEKLSPTNIQTITVYFSSAIVIFLLDLVTWYVDEESLIKVNFKKTKRR